MCAILMSINPQHVTNIMCGKKVFEFRKRACKRKVDKIYIYSTTPIMKVVGEAQVEEVLIDHPNTIWKITSRQAGIDKKFFDKYFLNREEAVAYKLTNVIEYTAPKSLSDLGVRTAPQSYQYIEGE